MSVRNQRTARYLANICLFVGMLFISILLFGHNTFAKNDTNIHFSIAEAETEEEYIDEDTDHILSWQNGNEYQFGSDSGLGLTVLLPKDKFTKLTIDGADINNENYTLSGDNATIDLKTRLLDSLNEGDHNLSLYFTDIEDEPEYVVSTSFKIKGGGAPDPIPDDPDDPTPDDPDDQSEEDDSPAVPNTGSSTIGMDPGTFGAFVASGVIIAFSLVMVFTAYQIKRHRIKSRTYTILRRFKLQQVSSKKISILFSIFILTGILTGGLFAICSQDLFRPSLAANVIRLAVTTSSNISSTVFRDGTIAKAEDVINVDTNAESYDIYVSSDDNKLYINDTLGDNYLSPNSNIGNLDDGSWGLSTTKNTSSYTAIPTKGNEILLLSSTTPGDNLVYYGAKASPDLENGIYGGKVSYSVIATMPSDAPLSISPAQNVGVVGGASATIEIPLVKNGDMAIETPEVTFGNYTCTSVTLTATENSYMNILCQIPTVSVAGAYDIKVNFPDLGYKFELPAGFTYEEEQQTPTTDNHTVTFNVNNDQYGTISAASISVADGTTYVADKNQINFSDGQEITVTPNTLSGYDISCDSWSPSKGTIYRDATLTAVCTASKKQYTITYRSNNNKNQTYTQIKKADEEIAIKSLAEFTGDRYSNVYTLNTTSYKNWTRQNYYFDYWMGNDGNKYIPDNEGFKNACPSCKTTFDGNRNLTLSAHFTPMNGINLAAITLGWAAATDSNGKVTASSINYKTDDITSLFIRDWEEKSWDYQLTMLDPYNDKRIYTYQVQPTPEFKAAATKYFTGANSGDKKNAYYYNYPTDDPWSSYSYVYGRSCDVFAANSVYYGIEGLEDGNTGKMPFGLFYINRYLNLNSMWYSTNSTTQSATSSSVRSTLSSATGWNENDYRPGDIRLVYRATGNSSNYTIKYQNNKYLLAHIAIYVKTEDGEGHIAEASRANYVKNKPEYSRNGGTWFFAATAHDKGGSFGHLTESFYSKGNEIYSIWRYY